MAQTTLITLGSGNGTLAADPAATASTVVQRDGSGNIAGVQVAGSEIKTSGTLTLQTSAKTANFTADANSVVYFCSASGGSFTATLPSAVALTGRTYTFTKTDSSTNAVSIGNAVITLTLSSQGSVKQCTSDGAAWQVTG